MRFDDWRNIHLGLAPFKGFKWNRTTGGDEITLKNGFS